MKIYFTAAIIYKKKLGSVYLKIVDILEKAGHQVISEHILKESIPHILSQNDAESVKYYKKCLKNISSADLAVVEASFPSTIHIGHEISIALERGKAVVLLYEKGKMPFFLEGLKSEKLFLVEYTQESLTKDLKAALKDAKNQQDVRFNFFITPRILTYLDWISKKKRIPRAVYLRSMIEKDMRKNKEYHKES